MNSMTNSRMWRTTRAFGALLLGLVLAFVGVGLAADEAHTVAMRLVLGVGLTLAGLVFLRLSFRLMGEQSPPAGGRARS